MASEIGTMELAIIIIMKFVHTAHKQHEP